MSQLKHKTSIWAAIVAVCLVLALGLSIKTNFNASAATETPIVTVVNAESLPTRALTGAKITLPDATATKADGRTSLPVTVRVSLDDKDITVAAQKDYVLSKKGIYNIYYEAYDAVLDFYGFASFDIDVRDVWLGIKLDAENKTQTDVGKACSLVKASAIDFAGAVTTDVVKLDVKFGDLPVTVTDFAFTPIIAGKYTITYTAVKSGETVELVNYITAVGTLPKISVQNIPGTIYVKEEYKLPLAEASDADGGVVTVTIDVTFNNNKIDVKDNKFTPKKTGDYTILYTVTNSKGISASVSRVVKCIKQPMNVGLVIGLTVGIGGGLLLIGGGILVFFIIRKKRNGKNDEILAEKEEQASAIKDESTEK